MSIQRFILGTSLALAAVTAQAAPVIVNSVAGTGTFSNAPGLISDGVVPALGTFWADATTVSWSGQTGSAGVVLTLTFDQLYTLQDALLSVDNNDNYRIQVSTNGSTWNTVFRILGDDGRNIFGMDTYSTVSGDPSYIEDIDFAPVQARYARIYATGGDGAYSVGELSFSGVAAVPEPETYALALAGLGVVGGMAARRRRRTA